MRQYKRDTALAIAGGFSVILPESAYMMHAFMQYRDDTDIAVTQPFPVNEMPLVTKEKSLYLELGRNRTRGDPAGCDSLECLEESRNVRIRLALSPAVTRVPVDFVYSESGRSLDANLAHAPDRCLFLWMTSEAVSNS